MITQSNKKVLEIKEYLGSLDVGICLSDIEHLDSQYNAQENEINQYHEQQISQIEMKMSSEINNTSMHHDSIIAQYRNQEMNAESEWKRARAISGETSRNVGTEFLYETGFSKKRPENSTFLGGNQPKAAYERAKSQRKKAENEKKKEVNKIKSRYNNIIYDIESEQKKQINELNSAYENNFFSLLISHKPEIVEALNDLLSSIDYEEDKYNLLFPILTKIDIALLNNIINISDIQNTMQETINIEELKKISQNYTDIYESNKSLFNEIETNDTSISSDIKNELDTTGNTFNENKKYTEIELTIDLNDKEQLSKNKKDFSLLKQLANNNDEVMTPIKNAIGKYKDIKSSDSNKILEDNYNNAQKIIEEFEKIKGNELLDLYNEFYNNEQTSNELKELVKDKFYQGGIAKLNDFNQNSYFVKDLEKYPYLENLNYIKSNILSFEEFVKNVEELDFDKFKEEIAALKKKIWIKRIIISLLVASLPLGYFGYEFIKHKQEQAVIEQQRAEKQERIRKEREKKEAIRAQNNIKRVESSIFVDSVLKKEEKSLLSKINKENISESNKQKYISKYTKFTKETFKNIDVKSICAKEANKDTSAIAKCTQNNQKFVDDFSKKTLDKVPSLIDNRIFNIKLDKKRAKLNSIIKDLEKKNKSTQDKASKLKHEMDGYLIDGKKAPKKLQSEVDKLNSQSKNYTYQIKEYKKQIKNKKLTIIEPTMTKQKVPVKKETIKESKKQLESAVQPKKEIKTISKESRIKQLQELIDDAYINGNKPDPKLVKELNKLKGTN